MEALDRRSNQLHRTAVSMAQALLDTGRTADDVGAMLEKSGVPFEVQCRIVREALEAKPLPDIDGSHGYEFKGEQGEQA